MTVSTRTQEIAQVINALPIDVSVLPVVPAQSAEKYPSKQKDEFGNPKPMFNGKNPSYFDASGNPRLVRHTEYQNKLPSATDIAIWFQDERTGVGCLGGDLIIWIDLDRKNFDSDSKCDAAYQSILDKLPSLDNVWLESTQSGGYRIGLRVAEKPSFTNFSLTLGGAHIGEALGSGRFTVLAPTVGAKGSYINQNRPTELLTIPNLESIGIYSHSISAANTKEAVIQATKSFLEVAVTRSEATIASDDVPEISPTATIDPKIEQVIKAVASKDGSIPLITFISQHCQDLFYAVADVSDKSAGLTALIKDLQGSHNWLTQNNVPFLGNVEELAQLSGARLGLDAAKVTRIIKSIKADDCVPARFYAAGGNVGDGAKACWSKVKELQKLTCQNQFQDMSKRQAKLEAYKKRAESLELETTHIKLKEDSDELETGYTADILKVDEHFEGRLKFNEMSQECELDGENLNLDFCHFKIAAACGLVLNKDKALDIVTFITKKNGYSPIKNYQIENHQKTPINKEALETIATRYFGNPDPLVNKYMRLTLILAVARAVNPGCKADTMTILYGVQGSRKSSFWDDLISVIPNKNLFTDSLSGFDNKDELAKLRKYWGHELGEVDGMVKNKEVEDFKRFLTRKEDTYRPPYARRNESIPRTCFFVGTTNKKNLLRDSTGDRRFWMVDVLVDKIDTDALKLERDTLWATAYDAYINGETWYLSEEDQQKSNEHNKQFQDAEIDPWYDVIQGFVNGRDWVQNDLIYSPECLLIEVNRREHKFTYRIANVMKALGYESERRREKGMTMRVRGWVKVKTEQKSEAPKQSTVQTVVSEPQPVAIPVVSHTPSDTEYAKEFDIDNTQSVIEYLNAFIGIDDKLEVGKAMYALTNSVVKYEVYHHFGDVKVQYFKDCKLSYMDTLTELF